MSKSRLLSGKVIKVSGNNLEASRTEFLDLSQAEPDLGYPPTVGGNGTAILVSDISGNRSWVPNILGGGVTALNFNTSTTASGAILGNLVVTSTGGLQYTATVTLNTSTVIPGTYGDSQFIPVITVDQFGRVTAATTMSLSVAISSSGTIYITNTSTNSNITLDPFTNTDVTFKSLTLSDALYGPANFVIDPATTGTIAGTVIIRGNLQVEGTQTIIDSTTLNIEDKNITLAKGSTTSTQSDGAGITVNLGSTSTNFYYDYALDRWVLDKPLSVVGTAIGGTGPGPIASDVSATIFDNKQSLTTSTLAQNDLFLVKDVSSGTVKITTLADFGIAQARAAFVFSPTPPLNPQPGDRWVDSNTMNELLYVNDGNSSQWIQVAPSGPQGLTGFTGSQGPPQGYSGSQGPAGTSVRIVGTTSTSGLLPLGYTGDIGDGFIVSADGHLWVWFDAPTYWTDVGEIRGPQGERGFVGSQAYTGSQGYTGSEGYVGSLGPIGYAGSPGEFAAMGYSGSVGDLGYTGSIGYSGSRGWTGSRGFTGCLGYAGSFGFTGSLGYAGSFGFTGSSAPGFTGSVGEVTLTGGQTLTNKTFAGIVIEGFITETVFNNTGTALSATTGTMHRKTLTAVTTFTDNLSAGQSITLQLLGGNTWTVFWPSGIRWVSGSGNAQPSLSGNDFLVFWKVTATLHGSYVGYTI